MSGLPPEPPAPALDASGPAHSILAAQAIARVIAVDPAFSQDQAAIVAGRVTDGHNGLTLLLDRLVTLDPPLSPDRLVEVVQEIVEPGPKTRGRHLPALVTVDASNNLGVAADLLSFVDRRLLLPVKIAGGTSHALTPEVLLLAHDPGGKPIYTSCWGLSRMGLLEGLDRGLAQRRIVPPTDPDQDDGLRALRQQMSAARLEVTASGRERVIAARDDLLIAVALCWWSLPQAVRLAAPRTRRPTNPAPSAAAWT